MSRLTEFTIDELSAVVFVMDIAQTVEALDEMTSAIREEMIQKLQLRNINKNI
jgi:hypothetical protein